MRSTIIIELKSKVDILDSNYTIQEAVINFNNDNICELGEKLKDIDNKSQIATIK